MIVAVAFFCVVAAVLVVFLRQHRPDFALLLSAAAGVVAVVYILSPAVDAMKSMGARLEDAGLSAVFTVLLKTIGVCYVTDFSADLCRDFGQSSLASKVELAGRISVVVLCFPLVEGLLQLADRLIGM